MRSNFGATPFGQNGFGADSDPGFSERSVSQDQLAIVWTANGDVVVASPLSDGRSQTRIDVARFPAGTDIAASVSLRRTREFGLPALSRSTYFLSVVDDHSERTRILALDGEKLAYDDPILLEWLVNAERQLFVGTDNHPVFETSLEDTACGVVRLPNGQISMTEVPRQFITNVGVKVRNFSREPAAAFSTLCVETPLRCIARYFLTQTKQGADTRHQGRGDEVTAFMSMHRSGYSFGLWSPKAGLFSENAFLAPTDPTKKVRQIRSGIGEAPSPAEQTPDVNEYIRKAFDQLLLQMSPAKLENLQLSGYTQVVYAAERELIDKIGPIAAEITGRTGLEFLPIDVPVEEAVVSGLLLGSYGFGSRTVGGAEVLPPVNLARDIAVLADAEENERRRNEEIRLQNQRNKAVLTVLGPPVAVAGILVALILGILVSNLFTAIRESQADGRTAELKPALDRRKAYEANLKWYQEFISEVSRLRKQQPAAIGLLKQLNGNYPIQTDPSFYVSDLKLTPDGDIEMKGLSRNKDSVATFLKSLEFAGGEQSGSRLFSNLAYEVQEVAQPQQQQGGAQLPQIAGSTLRGSSVAPGVVQWRLTGNYAPVAEFKPKPSPSPGAAKPAVPAVKPGA